jgi:adenine-specific DNA-methyltransferase
MDKLKMHSPDLIEANIARLAELFPNCVTEAKDTKGELKKAIDFDLLRQELASSIVEGPQERYQINWPGKREALLTANAPIAKTLRPCREESVDFDTTQNLFIEGDNLDALKLLQETYLNKVKLIYIDPPYNTGNDFIYEDDFAVDSESYFARSNQKDDAGNRMAANPESNGRFHSDWLTMMYPRLRLARNLLREDGAIFINIDSNEAANLQEIMDEIFGGGNFVTQIAWQKRVSPANDAKWFSSDHDLLLVYAKSKEVWRPNKLQRTAEQLSYYKNPDNDPKGPWNSATYTCNKSKSERPNLYYPITNPNSGKEVWPKEIAVWKYGKEETERLRAEGRLYWGANGNSAFPRVKLYLSEMDSVVPRSVWSSEDAGHTQAATTELKNLFDGNNVFDSPKPVRLLNRIIGIGCSKPEDIVLDFFAGSGTTAHGVLSRGAEAKPCRYILVQLPEPIEGSDFSLISDITKERIRRAGKKIKQDNADESGIENLDIGFRVLKIDSSNMKEVYYTPDAVTQEALPGLVDNIRADRSAEDLLFQVLLDWGVDLALPISQQSIAGKTVFFVDGNALAACFETGIDEDFVKQLAAHKPLRVVFRDAGFVSDSVKINVEQVFKLLSPATEIKTL